MSLAVEERHETTKRIMRTLGIEEIVAMTLTSNCHLVLGHNANEPTEYSVDPFLEGISPSDSAVENFDQCGSDGI